jgi:hypothetical protein
MRTKEDDKNPSVAVQPLSNGSSQGGLGWDAGLVYAESQNLAREVRARRSKYDDH